MVEASAPPQPHTKYESRGQRSEACAFYKHEFRYNRSAERDFSCSSPKYTTVHEPKFGSGGSRKHCSKEAAPADLPYLKPLPKPPHKSSSASACHRSAASSSSKHKKRQPFTHQLQKHHSDESLASYSAFRWSDGQPRAHSSADEISSLNHSPSVSSSDESFSKTTDASPSPPVVHDSKRWIFTAGVNPCSSAESSPRHTFERPSSPSAHYRSYVDAAAMPYRPKEKSSGQNRTSSGGRRNKISHEALMALAMAEGNTTSESTNCLSAMDSYQGDTCTSFEYKKHSKRRRHQQQHKQPSSVDKHNRIAKYLGNASAERRKANVQSQDEETQVFTCSKKDSSSQTDLKIPHCVTSLLSKKEASAANIEQKIMQIFEEQDSLQNASDSDMLKEDNLLKGYSEESLLDEVDFETEKTDMPKEMQYNFKTVDESHYLR